MMMLGEEEDAQHLLQILYSDKIRERTADRFDLVAAYGIEANSKHKRAELYEAFKDNVSFEYTKYGTVRVEVMDVQAACRTYNILMAEGRKVTAALLIEAAPESKESNKK